MIRRWLRLRRYRRALNAFLDGRTTVRPEWRG